MRIPPPPPFFTRAHTITTLRPSIPARPWLANYDPWVPERLEYPARPLYDILATGAADHPDRTANLLLKPGTALKAVVLVENCGARKTKEADVDERSRVLMATFLGAVVGGVWGWLYMTESGRRVRDQIEPKLDDFMNELTRVRGTVEKARSAANEGWRSLGDITGGGQGRWSA